MQDAQPVPPPAPTCSECDGLAVVRIGSGHNDREVSCPACTEQDDRRALRDSWRWAVRA